MNVITFRGIHPKEDTQRTYFLVGSSTVDLQCLGVVNYFLSFLHDLVPSASRLISPCVWMLKAYFREIKACM